MYTKDEALGLVKAAFLQAQRKGGSGANMMTMAVLKNRLLQITDRRFDTNDFGAVDMRAFVTLLTPIFKLVNQDDKEYICLEKTGVDNDAPKVVLARHFPVRAPAESVQEAAAKPKEDVPRRGRIREDLWTALMDYASGNVYVWDSSDGLARPKRRGDSNLPIVPTLTPVELAEWRRTFLEEQRDYLQGSELASAQRWQEQGLATAYLPGSMQQIWNRELAARVRQRSAAFFAALTETSLGSAATAAIPTEAETANDALADSLTAARNRGDGFTVGELLAKQLPGTAVEQVSPLLARVVSAWASPRGLHLEPDSLASLQERANSFSGGSLAVAFVNAIHRIDATDPGLSEEARDFAFKLKDEIATAYGVQRNSPIEMCRAALVRLEEHWAAAAASVVRFLRTTPATAKIASIDLLKVTHRLQPMLIPAEKEFLSDLDVLLGPAFRKICEAHERNEDTDVVRRAPELLENIKIQSPTSGDPRLGSQAWQAFVKPVLDHLTSIIEDASSRGETALAPVLALRNPSTKADLRAIGAEVFLSFTLRNIGKGHARDVSLQRGPTQEQMFDLAIVEPTGPFDVPANGERLVRIRLVLSKPQTEIQIPIQWTCVTGAEKTSVQSDRLLILQQVTEPNWESMLAEPPYSLNPIKRPERLHGRDSLLRKLNLAAMAGTSTFVWGQKRIGKTSLLQVLAAKLTEREDTTCILLRMGELASLHEGQLAHRIARRLVQKASSAIQVPAESEFGAGINLLVPFVEQLSATHPKQKFVVIIDEFDDLDAAFYTGERGRQFIKGLRSASEAGLTFFFIGSERMDAIFSRHQADLNKWTNVRLDRIDSAADCRSLIEAPVGGAIEFDPEAIEFITGYTSGNPFFINNFCYQIFDRCLQEHRTFVDANDTSAIRQQLLRSLGATNFSHFWEDNPVLDAAEKRRDAAENCVALSCISALGGRYEGVDELLEAQDSLPIDAQDRAQGSVLRRACARLLQRGVLEQRKDGEGLVVALQIFREWLGENARAQLLPIWCNFLEAERVTRTGEDELQTPVDTADTAFPISDDDMLIVAQRLIYCGRQKDVAEIKSWLRQFDDDSRIEIAFLLLQRMADKGFINEGMRGVQLEKVEQTILARRNGVGHGIWKIVKGRRDNLAIGYLDAEHKSGATMARDLKSRVLPGKCVPAAELGQWMRMHLEADAMVAIVDDFSGTGETMLKGLRKFKAAVGSDTWERYVQESRIAVFIMFSFPEALGAIRSEFPEITVHSATVFGDELRACSDQASIFSTEDERVFAQDVVQQIGRELVPGTPLGHGAMGVLVIFHNTAPNNTLPIFWSGGSVQERPWKPLFPRP
jgi:hypothetical protein